MNQGQRVLLSVPVTQFLVPPLGLIIVILKNSWGGVERQFREGSGLGKRTPLIAPGSRPRLGGGPAETHGLSGSRGAQAVP